AGALRGCARPDGGRGRAWGPQEEEGRRQSREKEDRERPRGPHGRLPRALHAPTREDTTGQSDAGLMRPATSARIRPARSITKVYGNPKMPYRDAIPSWGSNPLGYVMPNARWKDNA